MQYWRDGYNTALKNSWMESGRKQTDLTTDFPLSGHPALLCTIEERWGFSL
jgi:hypothetical protein